VTPSGDSKADPRLDADADADADADDAPAAFDQLLRRAAAARTSHPVQPEGDEDVEADPPPRPRNSSN
jgi:hypothetical protein